MTTQNSQTNTVDRQEMKKIVESMLKIMLPNDAYQYMCGALSMATAITEQSERKEEKSS